jgi:hypothetical protein
MWSTPERGRNEGRIRVSEPSYETNEPIAVESRTLVVEKPTPRDSHTTPDH